MFFELGSKASNGRRNIRFVAHEIYSAGEWNENGITWLEPHVLANIDTAACMSITAALVDGEIPLDHGFTGNSDDGMPEFEYASVVGWTRGAAVESLVVGGREIRALVCEGCIDEMRFPRFVAWLEAQAAQGPVRGSVEICARERGGRIAYEGGYREKGRVPSEYAYSGYSIITVRPADASAIMIELNNTNKTINDKGDQEANMDEKFEKELVARLDELGAAVAGLSAGAVAPPATDRDAELEAARAELEAARAENAGLKGSLEAAAKERDEAGAALVAAKERVTGLEAEMAKREAEARVAELESALKGFSEKEKEAAKDMIERFSADPAGCGIEAGAIVDRIKAARLDRIEAGRGGEQNSLAGRGPDLESIFGPVEEPQDAPDGDGGLF